MSEHAELSEYYTSVADVMLSEHPELGWIEKAGISVGILVSDREKKSKNKLTLGECIRVKDLYRCFIPYDFLIVVYEPNVTGFTEEQLKILLYHEYLHIGIEDSNGETKCVITPHDIEDFYAVIEKYGLGWSRNGG